MSGSQSVQATTSTNGASAGSQSEQATTPTHEDSTGQSPTAAQPSSLSNGKETRPPGNQWLQAYGATLVAMITIIHIVASINTAILYVLLATPSGGSLYPIWYAPVFGSLATYILFAIIAIFCCNFIAFAESANSRSYELLQLRIRQINARLEYAYQQVPFQLAYRQIAYQEARGCYDYVEKYLQNHRGGMQWVTGIGYINAWSQIHSAEEALIKIEPPELVLLGAMHDQLAIQNSTIGNRDELLQHLIQAAKIVEPAGAVYFQEHQVPRSNNSKTTPPKEIPDASANVHKDYASDADASARMTISEVRRTLNDFRDGLWEGLVRERNQLLLATAVTALVTHLLLTIVILMAKPTPSVILGVVAFYMVGAVAGLFGILHNESNKSRCIDDYGLSQARLIATPLLSGLAGIGGVLITIILYTTLLMPAVNNSASVVASNQAIQMTLKDIFRADEPSYLLTAAVFGLAPNLIIGALRQRSMKYVSDLQKSKSSGKENEE